MSVHYRRLQPTPAPRRLPTMLPLVSRRLGLAFSRDTIRNLSEFARSPVPLVMVESKLLTILFQLSRAEVLPRRW